MPRMELEDERGRYEAVIPEEPDTRKLRILRDWLDLGIRDYEPTSDRCDECENEAECPVCEREFKLTIGVGRKKGSGYEQIRYRMPEVRVNGAHSHAVHRVRGS